VLNPPALDTLAGTLLSTPEMIYLAHQMGFETPMMITLESGERALELLSTGVAAKYTDLGDVWIADRFFSSDHTATLQKNGDHFRVKEEAPGKPVFVTLVGDQFFVCTNYRHDHPISMAVNDLPAVIKARIKNLQERLNLVLAEYSFRITENGRWYFCGYGRPPVCSIQAFGDTLLEAVVDYATKKGETE
jgi:hypothetical protein